MIRITIQDSQQTVSFPGDEDILRCLVAGCSVNPASLGELLVASDVYQRRIAASLMADLMEFDKALRRDGPDPIHAAISRSRDQGQALALTFQAFDEVTRQEACQPRACELVLIDLTARTIRASTGINVLSTGEIHVHRGESIGGPSITYILPRQWTIQAL